MVQLTGNVKAALVATGSVLACYALLSVTGGFNWRSQLAGGGLRRLNKEELRVARECEETKACVVVLEQLKLESGLQDGWSMLPGVGNDHHKSGFFEVVGKDLWAVSGMHGDEPTDACTVFNMETKVHRKCPIPKKGVHSGGSAYIAPYFYLIGGSANDGPTRIAYKFNVEKFNEGHKVEWQSFKQKITPTVGHSCNAYEKKIYCAFGKTNTKPLTYTSKMEVLDTTTGEWITDIPDYPGQPRGQYLQTSVIVGNIIYYFGGITHRPTGNGVQNLGTVIMFNTETNEWLSDLGQSMPARLNGAKAVVGPDGNSVYLVGGAFAREMGGPSRSQNLLLEYRIKQNDWLCHPNMPVRLNGVAAMVNDGKLMTMYGSQYGYRTTGYGSMYELPSESANECPLYDEQDLVPDGEFPEQMMPTPEELLPGGIAFGANPSLD